MFPLLPVSPSEVKAHNPDGYLEVIATGTEPLHQAMLEMGTAGGVAFRSATAANFTATVNAMMEVSARAATFLGRLAGTPCPPYLRGADDQIQEALKLLADGGKRGADAARSGNSKDLQAAAEEMNLATEDVVKGAGRIGDWSAGAARP